MGPRVHFERRNPHACSLVRSPATEASITRSDLVADLGLATASVSITAAVHLMLVYSVDEKASLMLFVATAAALTFWRGWAPVYWRPRLEPRSAARSSTRHQEFAAASFRSSPR